MKTAVGAPEPDPDDEFLRRLEAVDPGFAEFLRSRRTLDDLWAVAREQRRRWGKSPVPTRSLLHEAYLRLAMHFAGKEGLEWRDRAHLLAVAATTMRQILIDRARKLGTGKRRESDDVDVRSHLPVTLEDALLRLEETDSQAARVVECRFFAGMTIRETATALELPESVVSRRWNTARAWLYRELQVAADDMAGPKDPTAEEDEPDA